MFTRIIFLLIVDFSLNSITKTVLGDISANLLGKDSKGDVVTLKNHKDKIGVTSFWAAWRLMVYRAQREATSLVRVLQCLIFRIIIKEWRPLLRLERFQ
ncbi:hypothetical protein GCM10027170_20390 [Aliiglaciecola aliphaticivorans]